MYANHIAIALCVAVIIGISLYGLREYFWMRAYNDGYAWGQANPNSIVVVSSDFTYRPVFAFQRRAFHLGARHAKGY